MSKLLLKTERLTIRDYVEADWQAIVQRTTQDEVAQYMVWDTTTWAEQEKVVAWIREQQTLTLETLGKYVEFAVEKDGRAIGTVGLKHLSKTDRVAEVGWDLDPECWGQGYASEATAAFMNWCFRNLELHRFTSICDARNIGSYKLMERLGMRREAHHVKSSFIKGEWVDDLVYAVLKDEWLGRPQPRYTAYLPLDSSKTKEPV